MPSQMYDSNFDDDDPDVDSAREAFERAVATRGLSVAFEACVEVAGDKNGTGASSSERGELADPSCRHVQLQGRRRAQAQKEAHEMSANEIEKEIARLDRRQRAFARRSDGDDDNSVFE